MMLNINYNLIARQSENNQVLEQITAIKTKTSELEKREFEKQKCQADYISKKSYKYKELKEK